VLLLACIFDAAISKENYDDDWEESDTTTEHTALETHPHQTNEHLSTISTKTHPHQKTKHLSTAKTHPHQTKAHLGPVSTKKNPHETKKHVPKPVQRGHHSFPKADSTKTDDSSKTDHWLEHRHESHGTIGQDGYMQPHRTSRMIRAQSRGEMGIGNADDNADRKQQQQDQEDDECADAPHKSTAIVLQAIPFTAGMGAAFGYINQWLYFGLVFGAYLGLCIMQCAESLCAESLEGKETTTRQNSFQCLRCLLCCYFIAFWIWGLVSIVEGDLKAGNGCELRS
jgi:hypothetical protein